MGGEWQETSFGTIPNHWEVSSLGRICQLITDGAHQSPKQEASNYFMASVKDMRYGQFAFTDCKTISKSDFDDLVNNRCSPERNDILISKDGANCLDIIFVYKQPEKIVLLSSIAIARLHEGHDPDFVRYFLLSPGAQFLMRNNFVSGSAIPRVVLKDFKNVPIPLPPLPEQRAIAHLLGSLDDKIELNRKQNATLEEMAQALFQSWFVDFDPVIDKALAAGNEIPEPLQAKARRRAALGDRRKALPAKVFELFPDRFVETVEMGWVPEGWGACQMQKHAFVEMGQSPAGDTYNSEGVGVPLVNGPVEFGEYFTERSKWTTAPTKLSAEGDLIVCVRGSTTGRFVKSDGVYCLGRGVCSIRGKKSQAFVDYIFKHNTERMLALTTGSTFPNWSKQTLSEFQVISPPTKIVDGFEKHVGQMIEKQKSNFIEIESLTQLRDTLLPKLISGELRVGANQFVDN